MRKRAKGFSGLVAGGVLAAAMILGQAPAWAKAAFPSAPVHIVVPYPAGGIVDIVARTLGARISQDWHGASIIIEPKPGADSNIGTAEVAHSAPDGYTWLITGPAVLVNPTLYRHAGWQPMKDFKCVGVAVWNQSVALVPKALPVKTMKEFVAYAKAHPGQLNFGNPGVGSSIDLTFRNLSNVTGMKLADIGYKGQPPALVDLIGNRVQFEIVSLVLAMPHIKDGSLRPLAVFTEARIPDLPNVPTIAEAGYPQAQYVPWYGIYIPAATPPDVTAAIHEAIGKALSAPEVRARLANADIPGTPMPLPTLAKLMQNDYTTLTGVIHKSGIKPR